MIKRVLMLGSKGPDVAELQAALLAFNPGPIDGDFGDKTLVALKSFQYMNGLVPDGVAGPLTFGTLKLIPTPIKTPVAPIGMRNWDSPGLLCPLPSERCEALDISRWQSSMPDPFAVDKKYDLMIAKSSQGLFKDSAYDGHRIATRKSTMEFTAYHWFSPNENAIKQAEFFMKAADLKSDDLFPMIDWEESSSIDPLQQIQDMDKFGTILIKEFGGALLYHGFFALQEKLLKIVQLHGAKAANDMCVALHKYLPVIAWYGVAMPKISPPWSPSDLFMWQWQANDKVEGIVADSVDHNWVYHSASDLPKFRIK